MKSLFPAKITICLRTVLLFGLLNGLLFSCGEGIRLLPFPPVETSYELRTGSDGNYQKNIHRIESQPSNAQFKYQRESDDHWAYFENSRPDFLRSGLTDEPQTDFPVRSPFSRSPLLPANIGSRAPPIL
jgi:hypothetical protein